MNLVYKIVNRANGKLYIGVTTQGMNRRWTEHVSRSNLGERDHKLYRAMRKYGLDFFSIKPICCVLAKEDLKFFEEHFIRWFNSFERGYNMTCGDGVHSEETIEKIRQKMIGRKITWYDKIVESRINNPNKRSGKEWAIVGAAHVKSKCYVVIHPDGHSEIIQGLREFCRKHGLSHNLMIAVINGSQHHHKGYVISKVQRLGEIRTPKRVEVAHDL